MRKTYIIFIVLFALAFTSKAQSILPQLEKLSKEFNFTFKVLDKGNVFNERYLLLVKQDLSPNNPTNKTFNQRVFISHKSVNRPVVFVTEGYWANYAESANYTNEITDIINGNQIVVEHRYFPPSVPDSSIFDWKYLTIENAAADHHKIVEILKHIYKKKWLNTGISKGGQTAIYHKYFYPNDVFVSVPIVAPLNFSIEEKRIYKFLKSVGTKECRENILEFQSELLENKQKYIPFFKEYANKKQQTYNKAGGLEKGYELTVLEYSFAFWQWGNSCKTIPNKAKPKEMVKELLRVSGINWISDQGIENNQPFFHQAMHEFGMYGYDITPFKKWVSFSKNPTFDFTAPKNVNIVYNPDTHRKIDYFLRHKAKNMIFIVGGIDPWGATSVDVTYETNSFKITKHNGSHTTRILNLPNPDKEFVISTIKKWME